MQEEDEKVDKKILFIFIGMLIGGMLGYVIGDLEGENSNFDEEASVERVHYFVANYKEIPYMGTKLHDNYTLGEFMHLYQTYSGMLYNDTSKGQVAPAKALMGGLLRSVCVK